MDTYMTNFNIKCATNNVKPIYCDEYLNVEKYIDNLEYFHPLYVNFALTCGKPYSVGDIVNLSQQFSDSIMRKLNGSRDFVIRDIICLTICLDKIPDITLNGYSSVSLRDKLSTICDELRLSTANIESIQLQDCYLYDSDKEVLSNILQHILEPLTKSAI